MKLKKILGLAGLAVASVALLAACGNKTVEDPNTLKVGVMTFDDTTQPVWDKVQELAEKEGVSLEFTEFTDYSQPNRALQDGELDVNAFQHKYFLSDWNEKNNGTVVEVADTLLSPIRIFSGTNNDGSAKYKDIKDLPDGAKVSIPNDASNGSRALYLLQAAGFIELDVSGNELATIRNISKNTKNLDITEIDAAQTATTLTSVDAAVINNAFAQTAKVDYKTTLYTEAVDENSEQWVNILAAQDGWKDSAKADAIKVLIKAYQNDEVAKIISDASNGTDFAVWEGAPSNK